MIPHRSVSKKFKIKIIKKLSLIWQLKIQVERKRLAKWSTLSEIRKKTLTSLKTPFAGLKALQTVNYKKEQLWYLGEFAICTY